MTIRQLVIELLRLWRKHGSLKVCFVVDPSNQSKEVHDVMIAWFDRQDHRIYDIDELEGLAARDELERVVVLCPERW